MLTSYANFSLNIPCGCVQALHLPQLRALRGPKHGIEKKNLLSMQYFKQCRNGTPRLCYIVHLSLPRVVAGMQVPVTSHFNQSQLCHLQLCTVFRLCLWHFAGSFCPASAALPPIRLSNQSDLVRLKFPVLTNFLQSVFGFILQ